MNHDPDPIKPRTETPQRAMPASAPEDLVCVTLQRPPHFWRFACPPRGTADLLERLAEMADNPNNPLTWEDAELIASEIVVHHHLDQPSADLTNDR